MKIRFGVQKKASISLSHFMAARKMNAKTTKKTIPPESFEVKWDENRKLRQYNLRRERDGVRMQEGCQSTIEKKNSFHTEIRANQFKKRRTKEKFMANGREFMMEIK